MKVKKKIGNGRFGMIRLGIKKDNGLKVAIKILSKRDMNHKSMEMVRTEIEILKICQHPNIITLYDVFENSDYFYIILEYCAGGDLFTYLESKQFSIPENLAGTIIHKLSTALFYLHQYGIAHRDLKLENILLTSTDDNFDIKLLDFGLSKIIGPTEFCKEPYGTIAYVSPEILLDQPYNKSTDLWSLGVITYLLLCGYFPFDDENQDENEIRNQTISEPVPFPNYIWKKNSYESKIFVEKLLQKNPNKRLKIEEVLEHKWIKKFCKNNLTEIRRKSIDEKAVSAFKFYSSVEYNK